MKATTAETNGSLTVFEDRVVRGKTTPLHMHSAADELVYGVNLVLGHQPQQQPTRPST
jgi:hypothetical protein